MFENEGVWLLLTYIIWHFDNFHCCSTVSKIHTSSPHNEALSKKIKSRCSACNTATFCTLTYTNRSYKWCFQRGRTNQFCTWSKMWNITPTITFSVEQRNKTVTETSMTTLLFLSQLEAFHSDSIRLLLSFHIRNISWQWLMCLLRWCKAVFISNSFDISILFQNTYICQEYIQVSAALYYSQWIYLWN